MTSFSPDMQNEKLAAILLVIVIVGSISVFLTVTYGEDILNTLTGKKTGEKVIALGDCVDLNYIGRFASNNTIFESSYNDTINKSGGTPLNLFISLNQSEYPPAGYETYSFGIKGLIEGLVGLKEGDSATIGPISPENAYGAKKLAIGDEFTTGNLAFGMNQTAQVTELTDENISLKWVDVEHTGKFTMPQMIINDLQSSDQNEMVFYPPPYYLWENSTEIINITDDTVTVFMTPTKSENLSGSEVLSVQYGENQFLIFPDATTAVWNNTTVTITSSPIIGKIYTFTVPDYYGGLVNITLTIVNVTIDKINVSVLTEGSPDISYMEANKTMVFNRTYVMPRFYKNIPFMYISYLFAEDIQKAGYSLDKYAGEALTFEVTVVKVYKTSQAES
jgi:FKBP-type peptidyl-prolyl cis-trans isomerase 2